jgi:hypothetical protein
VKSKHSLENNYFALNVEMDKIDYLYLKENEQRVCSENYHWREDSR